MLLYGVIAAKTMICVLMMSLLSIVCSAVGCLEFFYDLWRVLYYCGEFRPLISPLSEGELVSCFLWSFSPFFCRVLNSAFHPFLLLCIHSHWCVFQLQFQRSYLSFIQSSDTLDDLRPEICRFYQVRSTVFAFTPPYVWVVLW